jgi:penicillin-binding protein 1C
MRLKRAAAVAGVALVAAHLVGVIWAATRRLPSAAFDSRAVAAIRITARDGSLLRTSLARQDGGAIWVPLSSISPHIIQATLAGEDRRFFEHRGVDGRALVRAIGQNLRRLRVVSGGSTITMQLARLLRPAARTLPAKLHEAVLALKIERLLTKEQILWLYLNRAPYGNRTFGAEAAAQTYLGKPAAKVSLAEAALLAALPRSPVGYNPYRHRQRLIDRQHELLRRMAAQGRISAEQLRLALAEPIAWARAERPFLAPHLCERVLADPALSQATSIRTSLDPALQAQVETALRETVRRLRPRGVSNAAALVVENATGEVLAYVGSADFWSEEDGGQNDGTLARRQAGSTLKPFTYALALERGKTAASLLQDLPVHFSTDHGDYAPRNYDDTFHGPVRLRVALGSSYNVPAVHTAEHVGLDSLLARLHDLGLSSLDQPARTYGLGLTLGNGDTTLQELAGAYATLARRGSHLPLRPILEARTADGRLLAQPQARPRRVISPQAAHIIGDILSDPMARLPAFGKQTPLQVAFPASVKTGTSKDFRDNWTVGYTSEVTVAVWVGNFDGRSMHNISGITGAAPLWAELITAASRDRLPRALAAPEGLVEREVCPVSGELAGPHCGTGVRELFVAGSEPRGTCTMHRELALDRRNGKLAGPGCPEELVLRRLFTVYPPVYRAWAVSHGIPTAPDQDSPLCPRPALASAEQRRVSIRFPVSGDRYFLDPDLRRSHQRVPLEAVVEGRVREVRWLVDGREVARASYPYAASWTVQPGRHTVMAELPGGERSAPVDITVED